ncbi:NTP transferase domain-containing protein [Methanonatronarchaeum sp. AMET6-2]|uniref:NTP transferase domain-containing protein n=1 Tax=Methanonatronarchaeum sp. AMET6-2 TaxID=2933293 RepID=UPI001FF61F49|nr:NTP transferase domain-containing protein [Methanonatronarchaeum sp. AMET6-2]UOY10181.1 NTP transferase domain-containing protein [Methanonatronarchaeum sp. AMET6-2]
MKGVVLAGGRGTRFNARKEKQLAMVGGERLIDIIVRRLNDSDLTKVYVAVSENSPETWRHCRRSDYNLIRTRGSGYINDLKDITRMMRPPLLTIASDIPFIQPRHVNRLLEVSQDSDFRGGWTVLIPKKHLPEGYSRDDTFKYMGVEVAATGLNIVGETDRERKIFTYSPELGININTVQDLSYAREKAGKQTI